MSDDKAPDVTADNEFVDWPVSPRHGTYVLKDAYDALAKRCAELEAELEKIHAGSLWREAIQLRVENAELRARIIQVNGFLHDANTWADRLAASILEHKWITECRCDPAWTERKLHEPNSMCGELDDLIDLADEFHQWREKRGEG